MFAFGHRYQTFVQCFGLLEPALECEKQVGVEMNVVKVSESCQG